MRFSTHEIRVIKSVRFLRIGRDLTRRGRPSRNGPIAERRIQGFVEMFRLQEYSLSRL
jgi:hypothetical protein